MSTPVPSPSKPLADRDVNTSSPTKIRDSKSASSESMEKDSLDKSKSMEYHRQVLQSRLDEEKSNQKYISPSDTIMSPCTAKLNAYKSKQFMKCKPQSLFGKMETSRKAAAERADSGETQDKKDGAL